MMRLRGLFILFCVWMVAAVAASAQEGAVTVTDDDVNRVARQLYCPQCESVPLDACGTPACIAWRQQIRDFLEDSWTDQQIKDYFVREYGQRVLAAPSDPLINLLLAVVPIAAAVIGVVVFYRQYSRWQRNRLAADGAAHTAEAVAARPVSPAANGKTAPADDYRARLEREIDEVS